MGVILIVLMVSLFCTYVKTSNCIYLLCAVCQLYLSEYVKFFFKFKKCHYKTKKQTTFWEQILTNHIW